MSDFTQLLKTVAPMVGTAIAGPFGGIAASFIADKLGVESKTVEAVTKALSDGKMTPEQVGQIKLAEIEFQKFMVDNDIKREQLEAADRDSARKMQMATPSLWPGVLSAITTLAVLGVIFARMYGLALPNDPVTIQLIGSLTTGWGMALAYWFGTTHGSGQKNNLLAQAGPVK